MKQLIAVTIMVLYFGCSNRNSPVDSKKPSSEVAVREDYFSRKKSCGEYIDKINKRLDNENLEAIQVGKQLKKGHVFISLDEVCYSKSRNSCVGFFLDVNYDSFLKIRSQTYRAVDLFSNSYLGEAVKIYVRSNSGKYILDNPNYFEEKKYLEESIHCAI